MSAGAFKEGRYEDNAGNVWTCRVQPETEQLALNSIANGPPAGTPTPDLPTLPVKVSGRRGFGVTMRSVTVELTEDGTGSTADYLGTGTRHTVPVFEPTTWEGYQKGQVGTYLGIACKFYSKSPESVR